MTTAGVGRWLRWQRVPIEAIPIRHGRREVYWGVAYALFYVAAAYVVGCIIRTAPAPLLGAARFNQDLWYTFLLKIGLLLFIPVVALRLAGYGANDFLLGWQDDRRRILRLPLAFAAGVLVNVGRIPEIRQALAAGAAHPVAGIALGMILPLFTAGLPEEIFFRGFLQTRLESAIGRFAAILLASLLFTAWHLPSRYLLSSGVEGKAGDLGSVLLGTGVPVLIVGLLLGLAWDRWRNLPTLIALHWGVDTLPAVASFLGRNF